MASDTRRRPAPSTGTPPWIIGAVAAGVALVLILAMFALTGDDDPGPGVASGSDVGSGSVSDPTPVDSGSGSGSAVEDDDDMGGSGSPVKPPPRKSKVQEELASLTEDIAANPAKFRTHLDALADLRDRAGPTLIPRIDQLITRREQDRDRTAGVRFERLNAQVQQLVDKKEWDKALALWETFGDELRSDEWNDKIFEATEEIRSKRDNQQQHTERNARPPGVPPGGREVALATPTTPNAWVGWPNGQQMIRYGQGELRADNTTTTNVLAVYLENRKKTFRDFYFDFEVRIKKGSMRMKVRLPVSDDQDVEGKEAMDLNVQAQPGSSASWMRLRLWVRGKKATLFTPRGQQNARIKAEHGGLGLLVQPGDSVDLRNARLFVLSEGAEVDKPRPRLKEIGKAPVVAPATGALMPHTTNKKDLLADGLKSWKLSKAEGWKVKDGILSGSCPLGENVAGIQMGYNNAQWGDYTVTFEIRNVVGKLSFLVRWTGKEPNTIRLPATPDKTTWHKVRVIMRGKRGAFKLDNQADKPFTLNNATGGIGFAVDTGCSFEMRGLTITR